VKVRQASFLKKRSKKLLGTYFDDAAEFRICMYLPVDGGFQSFQTKAFLLFFKKDASFLLCNPLISL